MNDNENVSKNGWSEYGRLVLNELKRLNDGQDVLRKDFEEKFNSLNTTITAFKGTESEVVSLKEWKDRVTEVWSTTQMKEAKDEIYKIKGNHQKVIGILIAIQVIIALISAFKDQIFS